MKEKTCCPNCYKIHNDVIDAQKCWQKVLNKYLSISNRKIKNNKEQKLRSTQLKYYDMFDYIFDLIIYKRKNK